LLTAINFVTTILKMRAPGMGYMRMPVFCWAALATNLLIVAAFPVLTAVLTMLLLDQYVGFHFFTVDAGGNAMMYVNLFWMWGHPEVYILELLAFGVFSDVTATFSVSRCSVTGQWSSRQCDLHIVIHGVAAPFLHNGCQCERQRHFRHNKHDHRGADRS
jgi:heme/copper-type cytochrome/quinol oxidase subunit 1